MSSLTTSIITWRNGSGKGTVSEFLSQNIGGSIYRISDIAKNILWEFHIPTSRENLSKISEMLRRYFWEDIYAHAVGKYLRENNSGTIIFDGPRRESVIDAIENLSDSQIIWIETSPRIRYERMRGRGEKDSEALMSYEVFQGHEGNASEQELDAIRERADIVIENDGTREELMWKLQIFITSSLH